MQHLSPFVIPASIQAKADQIMAASRARFGHGVFRMSEGAAEGGGSGDAGAGAGAGASGAAGAGAAGDAGAGAAGDAGAGAAGSGAAGAAGAGATAGKVEDLPDWAQKIIRDTRSEAAEHRTKATGAETKQAKLLEDIGKALGLKKDEAPDPAKLAEELTKTQSQARTAAIELAVFRTAGKHKGDPDALLDSRTFLAKVSGLDPAAKDFADKVDAAIKDAVKDNPKLSAAQAAGSSSADHGAGGSGEQTKRDPQSLAAAVGGHYGT